MTDRHKTSAASKASAEDRTCAACGRQAAVICPEWACVPGGKGVHCRWCGAPGTLAQALVASIRHATGKRKKFPVPLPDQPTPAGGQDTGGRVIVGPWPARRGAPEAA